MTMSTAVITSSPTKKKINTFCVAAFCTNPTVVFVRASYSGAIYPDRDRQRFRIPALIPTQTVAIMVLTDVEIPSQRNPYFHSI